jgi:hypothetical protein
VTLRVQLLYRDQGKSPRDRKNVCQNSLSVNRGAAIYSMGERMKQALKSTKKDAQVACSLFFFFFFFFLSEWPIVSSMQNIGELCL